MFIFCLLGPSRTGTGLPVLHSCPEMNLFPTMSCHSAIIHPLQLFTIRVQLIFVGHQSAVVFLIRDPIVVIVEITSVSLAVFVVVGLVGVGYVGAVIQVVLVSVFINVLIVVTLVTNSVIIRVRLVKQYKHFKFTFLLLYTALFSILFIFYHTSSIQKCIHSANFKF